VTLRHTARRGHLAARALAVAVVATLAIVVPGPSSPATAAPAPEPAITPGFSPPEWLPLRRDLDGGEVTVGCTHQSHGSTRGYSCGGHHDYWAIDFMATTGTPVYAAGKGFATDTTGQSGASGYGKVVRIEHGDGITSLYAHLSEVTLPPEGAWVDADTVIGLVGSTGSSSAPHLHFERRDASRPAGDHQVDPGPLKACILTKVVAFPQIRDEPTWDRLPWGTFTVFSDGTTCDAPDAPSATPVAPVPSTSSSTSSTSTTPPTSAAPPVDEARTGAALRERLPSGWLIMALAGIGTVDHRG
jgi:murein DD-endopeptidase MepM/ murein hydrolase activator NlpD